ncbi:TPA: phosphoribosyltransferase [Enterobacter roggenkampii]
MSEMVKIYSCGVYHPYWSGPGERNAACDRISKLMMDFKKEDASNHNYAVDFFSKLAISELSKYHFKDGPDFVSKPFLVTIVPSHTKGRVSPALVTVAQNIVKAYPKGIVKLCLERTVTVPSAHLEGGDRSIDGHMDSIKVNDDNFNKRNVLLMDDVKTTGGSMSACYHLLKKAGAEKVLRLALLETAGYEER